MLTTSTTQASDLYSLATAAYTTLCALPLLLTPKLIISLLTSTELHRTTDVELYLARSHALLLLAFAALNLLLSGVIPLSSANTVHFEGDTAPAASVSSTTKRRSIYAMPTAVVTTTYHAVTAFYTYTQLTSSGWSFAFGAGLIASASLFCFGMWILLFGSSPARLSKTTGADKRTAGFPFGNSESAREIKKEAKEKAKAEKKERERGEKDSDKDKDRESKKRRSLARSGSSRG